mmetsp:Transcript_70088/g.164013  ORF Transcript_70088/g.164013 Transcript_70088/m.164013 type:complete len:224 (+) Transcript_70088:1085-1756(+)
MEHKGLPNALVGLLHQGFRCSQKGQLQLGLCFVQQKIAHVDRLPVFGQAAQSIGTVLCTCQGHWQYLRERREREEGLDKVLSLLPPMLIVCSRDDAVHEDSKVGFLAHVNSCDSLSIFRISNNDTCHDPLHNRAVQRRQLLLWSDLLRHFAVHDDRRNYNVASKAFVAITFLVGSIELQLDTLLLCHPIQLQKPQLVLVCLGVSPRSRQQRERCQVALGLCFF